MSDTAPKVAAVPRPGASPGSSGTEWQRGRNQQLSVAAIFALILGAIALVMGYFPISNTYSLIAAGLALLLAVRASLYALAGTVLARGFPVVSLLFSLFVFAFCYWWPFYAEETLDRIDAWYHPEDHVPPAALQGSADPATPVPNDAAAEATTANPTANDDRETYLQLKKQLAREKREKELNEPTLKPPRPPAD